MSWTEDDQIRYESEIKERKRKIVLKKLKEAQQRYDEAERNYQDTGSASTMRTMHRHEDMIMICELAIQSLDNVCEKCESRKRTTTFAVNKYKEAKEFANHDVLKPVCKIKRTDFGFEWNGKGGKNVKVSDEVSDVQKACV